MTEFEYEKVYVREEGNFAEQFNCIKCDTDYVCAYSDCGQIQHACAFKLSIDEINTMIRNSIGYFPSINYLDIIVNNDIFENMLRKLN